MNSKFQYLIKREIDGALMYTGEYNTYKEILDSFPDFLNIEKIRKYCHTCPKNKYKILTTRSNLYHHVSILKV